MNQNGKPKRPPKNAEPLDSCGETWWLSELTPALRKEFCRPIRSRARQALIDDREYMTDEQYAEEKDALQDRIDAGAYDWGPPVEKGGTGPGKALKAVLDTPEGQVQLARLLLAEAHGELPLDKTAEIIAGNPEGFVAALRAAMGLPPSPPEPIEEPGEKTETKETEEMTEKASVTG